MSRSALIVLAALFVAGAAAGSVLALPAGASQATEIPIVMLTIDSPSQSDTAGQSVDVSRAVSLQREDATNRIQQYAFEAGIESADGESEERERVRDELDRLDGQIDALRAAEVEARNDYLQERIDATTYLHRLARLDARASLLGERLTVVRGYAEERGIDSSDVVEMEGRLVDHTGPVRGRVGAAIVGEEPAIRVELQAASNGMSLSMIEDGTHVREAYRADERTAVAGTIPSDELYGSFTNVLVSDVYELEPQSTSIRRIGLGVYETVIQAPRTATYLTISAYIDGDTRGIFSEVQERNLDRLPSRERVVAADNGTRLVVHRSFPGGPLRIETHDNESGSPASMAVRVNGEEFRTGSDGELWTLTPRRYQFLVEAMGPSGNVSVEVQTYQAMSVNDDP